MLQSREGMSLLPRAIVHPVNSVRPGPAPDTRTCWSALVLLPPAPILSARNSHAGEELVALIVAVSGANVYATFRNVTLPPRRNPLSEHDALPRELLCIP